MSSPRYSLIQFFWLCNKGDDTIDLMTKLTTLLAVTALLVCVASCAAETGKEGEKKKERNIITRAPRSIIQACRESIKTECSSAKERRNVFICLEGKTQEELGNECFSWVQARKTCTNAVKDKCDEKKTSLRACLRKADKESLPSDCKDTDYFKSLTSAKGAKRFATGMVI